MYGFTQAGILANKVIKTWIVMYGYHPYKYTPILWKHDERPLTFFLMVDVFWNQIRRVKSCRSLYQGLEKY